MNKIKIAVAGRANTGKTTLIRTLMKSPVGEVGDRANVTTKGQAYHYDGLQADFVDTPGFRYAPVYNMYLDAVFHDPSFSMPNGWKEKIDLDLEAIRAIRDSNVVLYVGSLAVVPDESHIEEIKLVKNLQSQIVGILNQAYADKDKKRVENRINLWKQVFFDNGIDHMVVFDAHWDKYSKANVIYDQISKVVSEQEKKIFSEGLALFKKRQIDIRKEACKQLSTCIVLIQKIELEYEKKKFSEQEAKTQISKAFQEYVEKFVERVNELYEVASNNPTDSFQQIKVKLNKKRNWESRFGWGAGAATVLGGGGAAVGAGIGALAAGLLSGGLAAGPGAALGAQIGGAIGGGIGIFASFDDSEDKVVTSLEADEIKDIAQKCTSVIWGLSVNGYGRAQDLKKSEIGQIEQRVEELYKTSKLNTVDWQTVKGDIVSKETFALLEKLEKCW